MPTAMIREAEARNLAKANTAIAAARQAHRREEQASSDAGANCLPRGVLQQHQSIPAQANSDDDDDDAAPPHLPAPAPALTGGRRRTRCPRFHRAPAPRRHRGS